MEELERLMFRSACWGDQAIADDFKAQVWIVSLLGWLSWLGHGLGDQDMADKVKAQLCWVKSAFLVGQAMANHWVKAQVWMVKSACWIDQSMVDQTKAQMYAYIHLHLNHW